MPKQVIISMENGFPFGKCQAQEQQESVILVRKIFATNFFSRKKLIKKAKKLRLLQHEVFVKIETALEDDESVHCLFEYVPISFVSWVEYAPHASILRVRDQLIDFSALLAKNGVKVKINLQNLGLSSNEHAKYFIDLDYEIISEALQHLRTAYMQEITFYFEPYLRAKFMSTCSSLHHEIPPLPDTKRNGLVQSFSVDAIRKNTVLQKIRKASEESPSKVYHSPQHKAKNLEYYHEVMKPSLEQRAVLNQFLEILNSEEEDYSQGNEPTESHKQKKIGELDTTKKTDHHSGKHSGSIQVQENKRSTTNCNTSVVQVQSLEDSQDFYATSIGVKLPTEYMSSPKQRKSSQKTTITGSRETMRANQFRHSIAILKKVNFIVERSRNAMSKLNNLRSTYKA